MNFFDDSDEETENNKAYQACAAHNIQLVLKDAFEAVPAINKLINEVSKNIVSRSKFSALREFGKKFPKDL